MTDVTFGTDGGALLHLPSGVVGVRDSRHAHELADRLRQVGHDLEELERLQATEKDRAVGKLMNLALRVVNVGPVGTSTPTSTVLRHIVGDDGCPCSCAAVCGCDTDGAA